MNTIDLIELSKGRIKKDTPSTMRIVKMKENKEGGFKQYVLIRGTISSKHPYFITCRTYKTADSVKVNSFRKRSTPYTDVVAFERALKRIQKQGVEQIIF